MKHFLRTATLAMALALFGVATAFAGMAYAPKGEAPVPVQESAIQVREPDQRTTQRSETVEPSSQQDLAKYLLLLQICSKN